MVVSFAFGLAKGGGSCWIESVDLRLVGVGAWKCQVQTGKKAVGFLPLSFSYYFTFGSISSFHLKRRTGAKSHDSI